MHGLPPYKSVLPVASPLDLLCPPRHAPTTARKPGATKSRPGLADDVLSNAITTLEAFKDAAAISAVPFLGGIAAAALGIARAIEKAKATERHSWILPNARQPSGSISNRRSWVLKIAIALQSILDEVTHELGRGSVSRFFRRASVSSTAQECVQKLQDAWHNFDSAILIRLERQVEEQATIHPDAMASSIRPEDGHPTRWGSSSYAASSHGGEQYEGLWRNRPVTVRQFKPEDKEDALDSILLYSENQLEYQGNLTNVLAMAFPRAGAQFYVIDGAPRRSILDSFNDNDPKMWLTNWLQHSLIVVDGYRCENTYSISASHRKVGITTRETVYRQQDSTTEVASWSTPRTFGTQISAACSNVLNVYMPMWAHKLALSRTLPQWSHARKPTSDVLGFNSSDDGPASVSEVAEQFMVSELGDLQCSIIVHCKQGAKLGDYGYIRHSTDGDHFIRLGNLNGFLKTKVATTDMMSVMYRGRSYSQPQSYWWPELNATSHDFTESLQDEGSRIGVLITRAIQAIYRYMFFWELAPRIAKINGVELGDIVLACSCDYNAEMCEHLHHETPTRRLKSDPNTRVPTGLWFHQLPVDRYDEPRAPWGYWSTFPFARPLGEQPPKIPRELDDCLLAWPADVAFGALGPFAAQLVQKVNQLRGKVPSENDALSQRLSEQQDAPARARRV
ncbi:uncharacterized protein BXZ73DRAFT_78944 [Epithele typhae]|uniref:uncharacterized protein n=1 Tax=Epithele typhae TaxID=378194 RepID=UPI002008407C|nr:uncharacterized protein BXZ73DRAFT_78944 [Epithele typhae]KAH9925603.1 hypothetical protein BXZ73DRAFT_78944 [Epithele typhae]